MQDVLDLGDKFQTPGTDDDACCQVAQNCAELESAEQRYRDNSRGEKDCRFTEQCHDLGPEEKSGLIL